MMALDVASLDTRRFFPWKSPAFLDLVKTGKGWVKHPQDNEEFGRPFGGNGFADFVKAGLDLLGPEKD